MLFGGLDFFDIMVRLIVLLTAMPVHECAHGWVAHKLGDTTAERQGRLTLNPFHHIDPLGALSMLLVGFGWAKPVPVNPYYFRGNPRRGMALTALAGPASNLVMAVILCLACKLTLVGAMAGLASSVMAILTQILLVMAQINITLAVFNLLPIYPLDGFRILSYFLPARWLARFEQYQQIIYYAFLAVVLFTDILTGPLSYLSYQVFRGVDWLSSLFGLLPQIF